MQKQPRHVKKNVQRKKRVVQKARNRVQRNAVIPALKKTVENVQKQLPSARQNVQLKKQLKKSNRIPSLNSLKCFRILRLFFEVHCFYSEQRLPIFVFVKRLKKRRL